MKFIISGLLPIHMLHTKFGKIGLVVSEEKMLSDNARQTTDDARRRNQPIAIGHLSDSGDLIKHHFFAFQNYIICIHLRLFHSDKVLHLIINISIMNKI